MEIFQKSLELVCLPTDIDSVNYTADLEVRSQDACVNITERRNIVCVSRRAVRHTNSTSKFIKQCVDARVIRMIRRIKTDLGFISFDQCYKFLQFNLSPADFLLRACD